MKKIDFILSRIAAEHHTTPENVRAEMEKALQEAQQSTDPEIQAKWAFDFGGVPGLRREIFDKVLMSFPYFYA